MPAVYPKISSALFGLFFCALAGCGGSSPAARYQETTPLPATQETATTAEATVANHADEKMPNSDTEVNMPHSGSGITWQRLQQLTAAKKPKRNAKASKRQGKSSFLISLFGVGKQKKVPARYRSKNNISSLNGLFRFGRRRRR